MANMGKIYAGDCTAIMGAELADESVDTIFFSPPYDAIRTYGGNGAPPEFDLHALGKECHRVLKDGGMVGMVINDGTKDYAKSLTTYRTILDWCDNVGFRLFENVIYHRKGAPGGWWRFRFRVDHEYLLIFMKGKRPAYFDKDLLKVPSKNAGVFKTAGKRLTDGTVDHYTTVVGATKCRGSVWTYSAMHEVKGLRKGHPASMPIGLAIDFIHAFTPPDGVILDPMAGSGTSLVAAKQLKRDWIGIELNQEYIDLAHLRLDAEGERDPCVGDLCIPNIYSRTDIMYLSNKEV